MTNEAKRNEFIVERLVMHLKNKIVTHFVCGNCGYTQSHQIVFCPKCPGKMWIKDETELEYFKRDKNIQNNLYYKHLLNDECGYINWSDWYKIIDMIKSA
jgi:predicted nucleic-acid-binding Zn-ribbon protein